MIEAGLALLAAIVSLVPLILAARNNRRDNQNAQGNVDDATLRASLDAVDKLFPPAK